MFSYASHIVVCMNITSRAADGDRERTARRFNVPALLAGDLELSILGEIEECATIGAEEQRAWRRMAVSRMLAVC